MKKSMFGLASDQLHAQQILWDLLASGFALNDISVLMEESVKQLNGNINTLMRVLFDMQISWQLTRHFMSRLKQGQSLIVVNITNPFSENKAKTIFAKEGAKDIITLSENRT